MIRTCKHCERMYQDNLAVNEMKAALAITHGGDTPNLPDDAAERLARLFGGVRCALAFALTSYNDQH